MRKFKGVVAGLLAFCLFTAVFSYSPVTVSAADTPVPVANKDEFIKAFVDKAKTLSDVVTMVIDKYDEKNYNVNIFDYVHATDYTYTATPDTPSKGKTTLVYKMTYSMAERLIYASKGNTVKLDDKETQALKAAQKVVDDNIKKGMTDYEKELVLHDFIVNNTVYSKVDETNMRTPYGILVKKEGVCEGYSETMRLLMTMVGVWCENICGTSGGGNHMWNIVKIDGKFYQLDVTWDDPNDKDGVPRGILSHIFFNLTDEQMGRDDHRWGLDLQKAKFGTCTSTDYSYLYKNKRVAKSNDEFAAIAAQGAKDGLALIEIAVVGMKAVDIKLNEAKDAVKKAGGALKSYVLQPGQDVIQLTYKK